ncbi:MAG: hypothetical protein WBL07_18710, partial [Thiothrix litoralis]|uniref:hypothetical protein n=1 Tax=Thiothrix litoralis TaxID=2891210 RepID=UPI003C788982
TNPSETTQRPLAKGSEAVMSKPLAKGSEGLYSAWVNDVRAGLCKPSVEPTWHWIQKRIAPTETGSKTNDRTRISNMQRGFFARAIHEGLMQLNASYRNGGKKYIWIG